MALFAILFAAAAHFADLPRVSIGAPPRIGSSAIKRFVLLTPLVIDRRTPGVELRDTIWVRMPPGSFVPIAQDKDGVYYEATTPFFSKTGEIAVSAGSTSTGRTNAGYGCT